MDMNTDRKTYEVIEEAPDIFWERDDDVVTAMIELNVVGHFRFSSGYWVWENEPNVGLGERYIRQVLNKALELSRRQTGDGDDNATNH